MNSVKDVLVLAVLTITAPNMYMYHEVKLEITLESNTWDSWTSGAPESYVTYCIYNTDWVTNIFVLKRCLFIY